MKNKYFRRLTLSVLLIVVATGVCLAAGDDDNVASDEEISAAIAEIIAAERTRDASKVYAGIARRARDSAELRVAYIEKLIELDSPDMAYTAVSELVRISPDSPLAMTVMGYCQARRGDYRAATGQLAKAAAMGVTDEATMENLGQLVAHLDWAPKATALDEDAAATVEANQEAWAGNDAYQRGYAAMSAGYDAYAAAEKEIAEKIFEIKAEGLELQAEVQAYSTELSEVIARRRRLMKESEEDSDDSRGGADADTGASAQNNANNPNQKEIQALFDREEEIYAAVKTINGQVGRLKKDLKASKREQDRLPSKRKSIMRDAKAEFNFIRPVVPEALALTPLTPIDAEAESDAIVIDNDDGQWIAGEGEWQAVAWDGSQHGASLLHDNNANKGVNAIGFLPDLPAAGEYDVYLFVPAADFTATNVPVEVLHAGGMSNVTVNQQTSGGDWLLLGRYTFNQGTGGGVIIRTTGTDGYVFADAAKFQPVPPAEETTPDEE